MDSNNKLSNIKCRSIQILNHQNKEGTIYYNIKITLSNNQSIIICERYSELLNLHNLMSKEESLPNFPPKKFFYNTNELFLNQRQMDLNKYFSLITSSDKLINLPSFTNWIKNVFRDVEIIPKVSYNYNEIDDINTEKKRQKKIEKEINKIIPLFYDLTEVWGQDISSKEKENEYKNLIDNNLTNKEDEYIINEGDDKNFSLIGYKRNLTKMERLFNSKIIDINRSINIECNDKYVPLNIIMEFDL